MLPAEPCPESGPSPDMLFYKSIHVPVFLPLLRLHHHHHHTTETMIVIFRQFWSQRRRSWKWPKWVLVGPNRPIGPRRVSLAERRNPGQPGLLAWEQYPYPRWPGYGSSEPWIRFPCQSSLVRFVLGPSDSGSILILITTKLFRPADPPVGVASLHGATRPASGGTPQGVLTPAHRARRHGHFTRLRAQPRFLRASRASRSTSR